MDRARYEQIVAGFAGRRIVVLGDLMTDEYLWGNASRVSPESPVMVVDVERETSVPGGAANVVNNLLALGARVSVVGVVGDDAAGEDLRQALSLEGAETGGVVVDVSRPTTRKTRVLARSQQVLRIDRERTLPISAGVSDALAAHVRDRVGSADAVVISDYNKGVLTAELAASV